MVTIGQLVEYIERRIAETRLAGDRAALRKLQTGAGLLMEAAHYAGDKQTALHLQVLAAKAADQQDALNADDE